MVNKEFIEFSATSYEKSTSDKWNIIHATFLKIHYKCKLYIITYTKLYIEIRSLIKKR